MSPLISKKYSLYNFQSNNSEQIDSFFLPDNKDNIYFVKNLVHYHGNCFELLTIKRVIYESNNQKIPYACACRYVYLYTSIVIKTFSKEYIKTDKNITINTGTVFIKTEVKAEGKLKKIMTLILENTQL